MRLIFVKIHEPTVDRTVFPSATASQHEPKGTKCHSGKEDDSSNDSASNGTSIGMIRSRCLTALSDRATCTAGAGLCGSGRRKAVCYI